MLPRPALIVTTALLALSALLPLPPAAGDNEYPAEIDPNRVKAGFFGDPPSDIADWAAQSRWNVEFTNSTLDLAVFTAGIEAVSADSFLQLLRARSDVEWATYDAIARLQHVRDPLVPNPPTDPEWPSQYNARNIGLAGVANAWSYEKGRTDLDATVIVAILDSGVHALHEDLLDAASPYCTAPDAYDLNGHGTHVAGVVAAKANNGVGIAGIAQVKIACFKATSDTGATWYSKVAVSILQASALQTPATRVVTVLSLGGSCYALETYVCTDLEKAVDIAHSRGVVLVAASGNRDCVGTGCIQYPAAYPKVVAVGSINSTSHRSSWSAGGPELDLVAPGESIVSTISPINIHCFTPDYCALNGTSMAAPHVAGVAALVWSHCPGLTNDQVRTALLDTADDLGPNGWDAQHGRGRVQATAALHNSC